MTIHEGSCVFRARRLNFLRLFLSFLAAFLLSLVPQSDLRAQPNIELPSRIDPTEVVRTVKAKLNSDFRMKGTLEPAEAPCGVGPAFQIGCASGTCTQSFPSVAFDGTNYLVVWGDTRDGKKDIYCARVTTSGDILDPMGIRITTAATSPRWPAVAFGGGKYLVVWEELHDYRSLWDIYGARVTTSGIVLDPSGIPISTASNYQSEAAVAYDGTNYFVAWQDWRYGDNSDDIFGSRVTTSGNVLDPTGILISREANHQVYPSIASNGAGCMVVWEDNRSNWSRIYGARISSSGTVLDPSGILISTPIGYYGSYGPAVARNGTSYLVVWTYRSAIYGARVSSSGAVIDSLGICVSQGPEPCEDPSVAFGGTAYLVAWQEFNGTDVDIRGALVNASGSVVGPEEIPISTAPYDQRAVSVAGSGSGSLLVVYHVNATWRVWGNLLEEPTSIDGGKRQTVSLPPTQYSVFTGYPNPFSSATQFEIALPEPSRISAYVFNHMGQVVARLVDGKTIDPGIFQITWGGTDDNGSKLPSGIYLLRVAAVSEDNGSRRVSETKKIVLLR